MSGVTNPTLVCFDTVAKKRKTFSMCSAPRRNEELVILSREFEIHMRCADRLERQHRAARDGGGNDRVLLAVQQQHRNRLEWLGGSRIGASAQAGNRRQPRPDVLVFRPEVVRPATSHGMPHEVDASAVDRVLLAHRPQHVHRIDLGEFASTVTLGAAGLQLRGRDRLAGPLAPARRDRVAHGRHDDEAELLREIGRAVEQHLLERRDAQPVEIDDQRRGHAWAIRRGDEQRVRHVRVCLGETIAALEDAPLGDRQRRLRRTRNALESIGDITRRHAGQRGAVMFHVQGSGARVGVGLREQRAGLARCQLCRGRRALCPRR